MAQASEERIKSDQKSLEFEVATICVLGNHQLKDPKLLPCQHSFCKECIKKDIQQKEGTFQCPKCQLELPLTEKEVEDLKDDYLFQSLQNTLLDLDDEVFCVVCEFDEKRVPATFKCQDCGDIVCSDCKKGHTRTTITRNHTLVPIQELQEGKHAAEYSKQLECQKHSTADKSVFCDCYCKECKLPVCHLCVLLDHQTQGHSCTTLEDIWNDKSAELNDLVTYLKALPQNVQDISDDYEAALQINKAQKEVLDNKVHERAAKIIDLFETVKEEKLKVIQDHHANLEKSIKDELERVKVQSLQADSLTSYIEAFSKIHENSKANFLLHVDDLISKAKKKKEEKYEKFVVPSSLEMEEIDWQKMEQSISNNFGTIKMKEMKENEKVNEKTVLEKARTIFKLKNGKGNIYGLAVTENDDIIAVGEDQPGIKIYNSKGHVKGTIKCKKLKSASHLAVKGKDIYVSDKGGNVVLVMDMDGKVKRTIKLPLSGHGYIGLALDADGCVYMTSWKHHTVYKCEKYKNEPTHFITHQNNPDLRGPLYICITPKGELVLSNNKSNTIQIYNTKAELQWQYKGEGELQLSQPLGVACDTEGRIYIADCQKRLTVVDSSPQRKVSVISGFCGNLNGIALNSNNNLVCSIESFISKLQIWQQIEQK